ncbi:alpha/beta hydrolase [Segnochrobactraceae bacterium EtOH-i3]
MQTSEPQFLSVESGGLTRRIAVRVDGDGPVTVLWCGGWRSDMGGTKAVALADALPAAGVRVVRFDYSGHGESEGDYREGTIGRWLAETRAVYTAFCPGPTVIVGSSMGGWIALLLAISLSGADGATPVRGLALVAPAADFTEHLMWKRMPEEARAEMERTGAWIRPTPWGESETITRTLLEEGRTHLILDAPIRVGCPVRILQGLADDVVPWTHALLVLEQLAEEDVVASLVKGGDHRLSSPADLARLVESVRDLALPAA